MIAHLHAYMRSSCGLVEDTKYFTKADVAYPAESTGWMQEKGPGSAGNVVGTCMHLSSPR
jgi:hypothetical protein